MVVRLLPLLLVTAALAGCAADVDEPANADPDAGIVAPDHARVFSGSVAFGEATIDGTGLVPPTVFGMPDMAYVAEYGPEPNIGITSSGAIFTSMFSSVYRSTDNGTTWEEVHRHDPVPGSPVGTNNDPMLWVDPWTDTIYNAPMFPILLCSTVYSSSDDGETWTPLPSRACGTGAYDHQKFASGPPGPDALPVAGALHETVLYICYNGIAVTNCMASYDGGLTWPIDRPTTVNTVGLIAGAGGPEGLPPDTPPCLSGQNGHPTISQQGVVAMMRTWSCIQPVLTYSTDSGLTWNNVWGPRYPGGPSDFLTTANAHSIDPEVAFTPDGTMYVLFQSWDHHAYVARTSDLGATWEGPWDVTPPGTNSTVFAALGAGDDGRIAMGFVAANATGPSGAVPHDTRWHLWFVTSEDADAIDPTWVAYQASPDEDPVQIGQIHQGGGTDGDRNLLDFIDGAVSPDGRFYASFTDGCSTFNGCATADEQTNAYRGGAGAVAWLDGWSLHE